MHARRLLPLALGLSLACGGAPAEPTQTAEATETTQTPPAPSPLVGHWHGEMAGGPISAVADYRFEPDGTYTMEGYPSIAERGHYVTERQGEAITLHLTARTHCGPCESAGPVDPAEDRDETATLASDGQSLTWRGWTFARRTP